MGPSELQAVDEFLGPVEVLGLAALFLMLAACWGRGGRWRTLSVLSGAVLALTVAQPFGVKAHLAGHELPAGSVAVSTGASHRLDVFGVPLLWFRAYRRSIDFSQGGGEPTQSLKVRSWTIPFVLTNGTRVLPMCGSTLRPCWNPAVPPLPGQVDSLQLWRTPSGGFAYTLQGDNPPEGPGRIVIRLSAGIPSIPGLLFWLALIAAVLIRLLIGRRTRIKRA